MMSSWANYSVPVHHGSVSCVGYLHATAPSTYNRLCLPMAPSTVYLHTVYLHAHGPLRADDASVADCA